MNAVVIYESLTGNTRKAADRIARELAGAGVSATACPFNNIDFPALAAADLVVVGSWVDGVFLFGQRPGREGRLWNKMPAIDGKVCAVYCTYALKPGSTLEKLTNTVEGHGGEVVGGLAIQRHRIEAGAADFAERLLAVAPV
jgi:flavodoxin